MPYCFILIFILFSNRSDAYDLESSAIRLVNAIKEPGKLQSSSTCSNDPCVDFAQDYLHKSRDLSLYEELDPVKKNELKKVNDAVFSTKAGDFGCTGTYISNRGHFLSALHCVEKCYEFGDDYEKYLGFEYFKSPTSSDSFTLRKLKVEPIKKDLICNLKINGKASKARLMSAGKGMLFPYTPKSSWDEGLTKKYNELQDDGVWAAGDFAIFQLIDAPQTPCLKLAEADPVEGDKIQAISYTCTNGWDGNFPLYTEGEVVTKLLSENTCSGKNYRSRAVKGSFLTSLDGEVCSSGSSVLNNNFEIVGIVSMLFGGKPNETSPIGFQSIRASGISEIRRQIPIDIMSQLVCD